VYTVLHQYRALHTHPEEQLFLMEKLLGILDEPAPFMKTVQQLERLPIRGV
jgi:hypothetical protein